MKRTVDRCCVDQATAFGELDQRNWVLTLLIRGLPRLVPNVILTPNSSSFHMTVQ